MKKNKMMRIASVLMVVTLLSTCAISGTFAKYVTKASGEDSARVAKWGVLIELGADSVFAKEYELSEDHSDGEAYTGLAVKAEENVVAPGTSSDEVGDTITARISGEPEVATHYEISIKDIEDVFLPKGTYTDYTKLTADEDGELDYNEVFETEDYSPVKWTLTLGTLKIEGKSFTDVLEQSDKISGKLADLGVVNVDTDEKTYLTITLDVEPGTDLDLDVELAWAWDFESGNDEADTLLGNIAAGKADVDGANITVSATVEVLAVQID